MKKLSAARGAFEGRPDARPMSPDEIPERNAIKGL
jgi:hypothetical protein